MIRSGFEHLQHIQISGELMIFVMKYDYQPSELMGYPKDIVKLYAKSDGSRPFKVSLIMTYLSSPNQICLIVAYSS